MFRRSVPPIACWLLLLLLAGCTSKEPPPPPRKKAVATVQIGLLPERNIFRQIERYEPLAGYIFRKTGIRMTLTMLPRYGNIVTNFQSANLDGAFFGSFTYSLTHAKTGVEIMARPVSLDNSSTYHGLIFVRKDSRIRSAKDMKGKRFAFVDKATTAGYLLPLAYFRENGIPDYRHYLKEGYYAGTHEAVINDVLNRKADVGAAKNTVFDHLAKEDPRVSSDLVVLTRSPDVPENGLALRKDIDPGIHRLLKETLLNMERDPEGKLVLERFGALRFIETTNADYRPVLEYAKSARLDLATYDYLND
jgi:phosphonate transport system substrate-binding protein